MQKNRAVIAYRQGMRVLGHEAVLQGEIEEIRALCEQDHERRKDEHAAAKRKKARGYASGEESAPGSGAETGTEKPPEKPVEIRIKVLAESLTRAEAEKLAEEKNRELRDKGIEVSLPFGARKKSGGEVKEKDISIWKK